MPGTFASMAAIAVFYCVKDSSLAHIALILLLIIAGFLISGRAEKLFGRKDARPIVIDEVTGMLLSLLFIPCEVRLVIIAFILFRILDTLKPYPADRIENLSGSSGIMGDDIVCGIYTNIILQFVLRLASFRAS